MNSVNVSNLELLTCDEVRKLFKVSRQTVYNWRNRGLLQTVDIGGITRFKRSDLEELLKVRTVQDEPLTK